MRKAQEGRFFLRRHVFQGTSSRAGWGVSAAWRRGELSACQSQPGRFDPAEDGLPGEWREKPGGIISRMGRRLVEGSLKSVSEIFREPRQRVRIGLVYCFDGRHRYGVEDAWKRGEEA